MKIFNQILSKVTKKNLTITRFLDLIADNKKYLSFVKIAFLILGIYFYFSIEKTDFEPIQNLT